LWVFGILLGFHFVVLLLFTSTHSYFVVVPIHLAERYGMVDLTWIVEGENGVACNLESIGYKALVQATKEHLGDAKPYSIGGSLPLIRELHDDGFDVQIAGYGISSR
jgi:hypothetical protein